MPHSIQQYDDYIENKVNLDIRKKCEELPIPIKIIHGQDDNSVKIEEGEALAKWTNTKIHIIPNTQHTFDSVEPWQDKKLPTALKEACETALNFFNSCHGR
jgi:alpha/beta superfamily hydrolase